MDIDDWIGLLAMIGIQSKQDDEDYIVDLLRFRKLLVQYITAEIYMVIEECNYPMYDHIHLKTYKSKN